jgi:hypothetical protein
MATTSIRRFLIQDSEPTGLFLRSGGFFWIPYFPGLRSGEAAMRGQLLDQDERA